MKFQFMYNTGGAQWWNAQHEIQGSLAPANHWGGGGGGGREGRGTSKTLYLHSIQESQLQQTKLLQYDPFLMVPLL